MASDKHLRPGQRPAEAGRFALTWYRSPIALLFGAATLVAAVVFVAAAQLAGVRGPKAYPEPAFLTKALGAPQASAPLVRRPAPGTEVRIERRSYAASRDGATVSLSLDAADPTNWQVRTQGVSRGTEFGGEAVKIGTRVAEEYLTVTSRRGRYTWRWKLDSGRLEPRVGDDGVVAFFDGLRLDDRLHVAPLAIFDRRGRNVTPKGLRWSLSRDGGDWYLELRLDDSRLPLPYVIDPGIAYRSGGGTGISAGTSITLPTPAGVQANDILLAQVTVRGGTGTSITPNDGTWAALGTRQDSGATLGQEIYRHTGPPSDYQFNLGASIRASGGVVVYRGVVTSSPIVAASGQTNGSSANVTAPSIDVGPTTNTVLVGFFGSARGTGTQGTDWDDGAPGGTSERFDNTATGSNAGNRTSSKGADETFAGSGATGTRVATNSGGAAVNIGHLVALNPDKTAPTANTVTLAETANPDSSPNNTTHTFWYRPASTTGGTFTVTEAPTEAQSGVQYVTFPALAGGFTPTSSTNDSTSPYVQTYTWPATTGSESGSKNVTVTDNADNVSSATTFTISADSTAPPAPAVTFPDSSGNGAYNATTWNAGCGTNGFCGTNAADTGSGLAQVEISIKRNSTNLYWDGSSFANAVEDWRPATGTSSWSLTFPATNFPADGTYTVHVRSTDNVANVTTNSTFTFVYDTALPTSSADALPTYENATTFTVTYTASDSTGSGVKEVELWVKGPSDSSYSLATTDTTPASPSFSYTAAQGDGTYVFYTRAHDNALNYEAVPGSPPDSQTQLDTAKPTSSADALPSYESSTSFSVPYTSGDASGSGVKDVELWVKGPSDSSYSLAATDNTPASPSFSYTATQGDGTYRFYTRAHDNALNYEDVPGSPPDTQTLLDTAKPTSSADALPAYETSTSFTVTYSSADASGSGVKDVELWVKGPSDGSYNLVATDNTPASPSFSYTATQGDGTYRFYTRAHDNALNYEDAPGSPPDTQTTLDTAAPDTSITAGPANPSNNANPSLSFTSTEPGSTFACRLDGGSWGSCTSPKSYSGLSEASHTFDVRATDPAGNTDGSAASSTWTLDLTNPGSSLGFPSSASYNPAGWNAGCGSSGLCGSASDSGGAGLQKVELSFKRVSDGKYWDGSGFNSSTEDWRTATGTTSWLYAFPASSFPAEGDYTVRVRATDNATNQQSPSSLTFTFDTTAPNTTITANPSDPSNVTNPSFSFSSSESGSTFECRLDAGSWGSCSSPKSYSGLTEASHTFDVRATDSAANTDASPASFGWTLDTTNPASSLSFPAAGPYSSTAWNAGCAPNGLCGTASDAGGAGLQKVEVSIRRVSDGKYWDGSGFNSSSENWRTAAGTASWSYALPASSFPADGDYTMRVRATDNATNQQSPSSQTFAYDATAPNTTITANPADPSSVTNPSFSFSSSESGSSFECRLDGGSWASCTSPKSYSGLTEASHTFDTRATDAAGNTDASPASFTWTLDTTAPSSALSFPVSGGRYNASGWNAGCGSSGLCGSASDSGGAGLQKVDVSIKREADGKYWDGSGFNSSSEDWRTASGTGSWSYGLPASSFPADGDYTVRVRATDNATNAESPLSFTLTYDTTPPNTTITANPADPSNDAGPSFSFSSTESGSSFECRLDGGSWSSCSSPKSYSGLTEGSHTFDTRATDAAGNTDASPASFAWTLDTSAPSSSLTFPGTGGYNATGWNGGCGSSGLCGSATDTGGAGLQKVELSIKRNSDGKYWDGSSFNSASEYWRTASGTTSWSYGLPASNFPADGDYTVRVRATDNAANGESPSSRTFTYDTTAPDTTITADPADPSNDTGPSFSFSSTESGSSFDCRLDGGSWTSCTSPKSYSGLTEGSHTFDVRATDGAGNTDGSAATFTWTLDTSAPSSSLAFPGSGPYSDTTWNAGCGSSGLCGTASDTGGAGLQKVELSIKRNSDGKYWDGSGFSSSSEDWRTASGTASWSYAFPASSFPVDGAYTVRVRATDGATNQEGPSSDAFTYENSPPETTIDSAPASPTGNPNASFTFSANESGSTFECRVDGGSWSSCTSPKSYAGLAQDSHTFEARATDTAGNTDPSPASHAWTIDLTLPTSTVTFPAGGGQYGAGTWNAGCAPSGICGSAADSGGANVQRVEVSIKRVSDGQYWDGSGFGSSSEDWRTATGTTSWSYSFGAASFPTGGDYTVRVRAIDAAGNTESPSSLTLTFDTSPPTTSASVANTSGATFWNGSDTVFYRPGGSGGFDLTATVSDPETGAQKAAFPFVAGFGAGGDVGAPGPYASSYSYSGTPTEPAAVTVTGHNNAGLTSTASVTVAADSSAPSGGSVSYADGYDADGAVTITTDAGSDSGSGLDASSAVLERQTAPLAGGSCSGYGAWATATSPDTVSDGRCAVYRYRVSDRVGNEKIYTSPNVVKVDQSGPTSPALDVSESSALSFVSGTTLFYNPQGSNSGSFTVASTAGDAESGLEKVVFPALAGMIGGGDDASSPYSTTYDWTASSGASGAQTVTNRNNAGLESTTQFAVTPDTSAPTGGSVSYPDGYQNGDVTISTSVGSDGSGSGVNASSGVLERALATLSGGGCGVYGPWTAASSPDSLPNARCAKYRYRVSDNVGNEAVYTSPNVIRTDNVFPTVTLNDPGANLRQTVSVGATADDSDSGLATVAFQRSDGSGGWTTIDTDSDGAPYTVDFDTTGAADGLYDLRAIATDGAGNATISDVVANRRVDNAAPSATMGNPGPYVRGTVTLSSTSSDSGSGVASVVYELSPAGAGTWSSMPATWDTTATTDDLYDLHVVVTDAAGNQTISAAMTNVRVDNTLPAVSMDSPGPYVTGTVSLSATASDAGSGIDTVSFEVRPAGGAWGPTPATWDTSTLSDGDFELRAIATDRAGNSRTSAPVGTRVDNTDPTVAITTPTDGGYVNAGAADPFTVLADSTDPGSGVASVQFFECSDQSTSCATGTWSPAGTATSTPYQTSWSLPANGNHSLKATSTDNVGHTSDAVINVTIDRSRPDTTITGNPGNPSNVAAPDFSFDTSEPGSTFECQVDGGPFSACASPDTVGPLADGTHTFTVRAIDAAGNVDDSPAAWTWLVDTTLPTGAIDDPGDNLRGIVALTSTSDDPGGADASGVASVDYQYSADGGLTWAAAPPMWDTTTVPDGLYDLRVEVIDNAGNVFDSAPVTARRVDNTPPATALDDPGANLRQTVTLSASASDTGSGVQDVTFQVAPTGSGAWTTIGTATGFPYTASFDTATQPDGLYDFRTVARDVAGNQVEGEPVTMRRIDNTPPAATMTDPGAYLRGTVTLSSTTDDFGGSGVSSVVYEYASAGSGSWQPGSAAWNTTTVSDGSYDLHVVVTDAAGNETISGSVDGRLVDNTRPVTGDNAPSGWQHDPVTVGLSATDSGSGVANTQFSVDGGGYSSGTSATIPAPSDGSNDGVHTISYFSTDVAGNIESPKTASVAIDASPPVPGADDPGTYLRGTITLSANPSDDGAGIESVEFQYSPAGADSWSSLGVDTDAPYSAAFDTTSVPDGAYDLRFIVTDESDNTTTQDLASKIVDNTAPSAAVGSPPNGSVVSGDVTIGATALDANPIVSVEFFVGGGSIGTATSPPFTRTWSSTGGPDGPAAISVVVTDIAGNTRTSSDITVTVDNLAPTVSMGGLSANVRGTVSVSASADADTAQVTFERRPAGGGGWTAIGTATGAPWSAAFDTTIVPDGSYELRATAIDTGGNSGTSSAVTTRVDNTNPSGALTAPGGGATVGGSAIPLGATASDGGSGVASVTFQIRPPAGSWSDIASDGSAPFDGSWDATSLASGPYELRALVTDAAGNSAGSTVVPVTVDSDAPGVTLEDPGAEVSGTITLRATTTGDAVSVTFAYSPAGGATWTTIGTDGSDPYSRSFNTASVPDGLYDLRAVVSDAVGNTSASVRGGIRLDNRAPEIISSVPANGSVVPTASSIELTASEAIGGFEDVTLDGDPTVAPVISGSQATFNTGALGNGPHTLAGTVKDEAGLTGSFSVHFVVGVPAAPSGGTSAASKPTVVPPPTNFRGTIGSDGTLTLHWTPAVDEDGEPLATILYVNGAPVRTFDGTETSVSLGQFDPSDPSTFAMVSIDADGATSDQTPTLRAVPSLVGKTVPEAADILAVRGMTVGRVTGKGTVVKPSGPFLAPVGSAVDLELSGPDAGPPPTKLVIQVVTTKRFSWKVQKYVAARIKSTRPVTVTVTLLSRGGERLYRWRLQLKAGASVVKLRMPPQVRRPGRYTLVFAGRAGNDTAKATARFRIVGPSPGPVVSPGSQPVEVVLAGDPKTRDDLALGLGDDAKVVLADQDETFDHAGSESENVQVAVIDVDEYGVGLVRDLHTVFPTLRIVALSDDPKKLAQSLKAGATVALPRSTPPAKLAEVIRKLTRS